MQKLSGYWQYLLRIVETSREEGGGILKKKIWLCLLKRSPKSYILFQTLFPLPSGYTLQSLLNTVPFRTGINTHFFMHFVTLCRKFMKKTKTVVSCFMQFRSESMSGSIRNLTVLRYLRILEARAGRATLQIMLYILWTVVCIGSGSSRWLFTSVVEVLRLRFLCIS